MKRHLLAAILLLALAGLTFIQFRLLLVGLRLEFQRFNQRTETAMQAVGQRLNEPNPVSDALISISKAPNDAPDADSLFLSKAIDSLLGRELRVRGVTVRFMFAITDRYQTRVYLASPAFKKDKFTFGRYFVPLGERIIAACHCERVLYLDVVNLFGYLLGELDYLIIPSVLCLLAILFCLFLLIGTLRKEQKLNAIKNDFINNLTHELKTPTFSIALSARLAKESLKKGDPTKAAEFLRLIEAETEKLKTHVEKVLELASLESARYSLEKEHADLHGLIEEVLQEIMPQVGGREGSISKRLESTTSILSVDKTHFKNLLRNLLDNALKYTVGQPEIEVATSSDGKSFRLSVKDKGSGIPADQQKMIFDKFYRVTPKDGWQVKGFGLGLSYVKQIVKGHGGKIEVESRVGEGTMFIVVLPL